MKIIKITQTNQGEVAYLFDEETGRVKKVFVDDYTVPGASTSRRKPDLAEFYEDKWELEDTRPVVRPAKTRRIPVREVEYEEEDTGEVKQELPDKPRPSIIPEHLRGVFLPQDTPGAAVERRQV